MAEKISNDVLESLPKRGRVRKPARYLPEILEAKAGNEKDPDALYGLACPKEKAQSTRQALYAAAKEAGVRVRTWSLHEGKSPREMVAYRVIFATAEDGGVGDEPEQDAPDVEAADETDADEL